MDRVALAASCPERSRRAPSIEIPPAGAIRYEKQRAIRRPLGLENRLLGAAGDLFARADRAVGIDQRDPELGAVPRHVRMVPLNPRQELPVGADDRIRIEVRAFDEHATRHRDDRVLSTLLAHTDQSRSRNINASVRVTCARGCDRLRHAVRLLLIDPLIGEVRKEHRAVMDGIGAAAVFVHARADVEPRRRHIDDLIRRLHPGARARRGDRLTITLRPPSDARPSSQYTSSPSS